MADRDRLLAIHATTGATRVLDSLASSPLGLAPGGTQIYYAAIKSESFGDDSVLARQAALDDAASPRTLESCSFPCAYLIEPAPDGDHVAVGGLGDSLRIHRLSTGERTAVSEGFPRSFSPNSAELLVTDPFEPLSKARIVTIATGASRAANLGIPDTTAGARVRWGAAGIEVLYVGADRRQLFLRRADAGTTLLMWTSPDTLDGNPIAWSSSGTRAAMWSFRPSGSTAAPMRRWELNLVDLVARTARTIAHAEVAAGSSSLSAARFRAMATIFPPPSLAGLVFSPDETALAYSFFDGRIYRSQVSGAPAP